MDDASLVDERANELISQALGAEIKRQREARLMTRDELVKRTFSGVSVQSLFNYETGIRRMTVTRFVELALALDTSASMLLGFALQRAGIQLDALELRVDLHRLAQATGPQVDLISVWAQRVLELDDGVSVAVIDPNLITHWAIMLGVQRSVLVQVLATFTPHQSPLAAAVATFNEQPFWTARGW